MNRTSFKTGLILCFLIGSLIIAGCNSPSGPRSRKPDVTPTPLAVPVETEFVGIGNISQVIETTANIEAEQDITIYPKTSGHIRSISVEEGDYIKTGQQLCRLDDEELILRVQQSKVSKQQLEQKHRRIEELHDLNMASEEEYLDSKFNLESANVNLKLARLDLSHTRIKVPFDGIVVSRTISIGDLVNTSTELFRIFNPESLIINIYLPERDTLKLSPGMDTEIHPEAYPDQMHHVTITRINPSVDPRTGTVKVTLDIPGQTTGLKPGMFVQVKVVIQKKTGVVLVPKRALIRGTGKNHIFVMTSSGIAERRELTIGLEDADHCEVLSGVAENERIIVIGQHGLEDNASVYDIREGKPTAEPGESTEESIVPRTPDIDA
jgi:membrane fusion protein, multidrug efflux system